LSAIAAAMSRARRSNVSLASGVQKALWADSVTFGSDVST